MRLRDLAQAFSIMRVDMDKVYHFMVNVCLGFTAIFSVPLAIGLCVGASFGKEVGDALAKGDAWDKKDSAYDLIADLLGATLGILAGCWIRRLI